MKLTFWKKNKNAMAGVKPVRTTPGYYDDANIALHEFRAVYFFIPKVACTSVKARLAEGLGFGNALTEGVHDLHFPSVSRDEIKTVYRDYFKFCFVRNPWDRLVSFFRDKVSAPDRAGDPRYLRSFARLSTKYEGIRKDMPFEEFVAVICGIPDQAADDHFKSQHTFVTEYGAGGDLRLLTDFTGKFENLDEDFSQICRRIGMPQSKLPHLARRLRKPYREWYSPQTREMVRERYKTDIELFGYGF